MQTVRAVYEAGVLRLLEPVALAEGENVEIAIMSEAERVDDALRDVAVPAEDHAPEIDETHMLDLLRREMQGLSLSDAILDDRREGR